MNIERTKTFDIQSLSLPTGFICSSLSFTSSVGFRLAACLLPDKFSRDSLFIHPPFSSGSARLHLLLFSFLFFLFLILQENLKADSVSSTSSPKASNQPDEPGGGKPNKTQQLKKVFKEYGAVGVSFHICISLMSLGMFYLLISR